MEKINYVVKVGDSYELSTKVEEVLDEYEKRKEEFENLEKTFRGELLQAMIDNGIYSSKIGKYQISQIVPNPEIVFDEEKFLTENSVEVISPFVETETIMTFDEERFKKENPGLYCSYCVNEIKTKFDLKKLEKHLPEVYRNNITIVPSKRAISLRIGKAK